MNDLKAQLRACQSRTRNLQERITAIDKNSAANKLLDLIMKTYSVKNDAALSRLMGITPPQISKMRYGKLAVTGDMIIRIHELTGWAVKDIKTKLGLPIAFA